MPMQADKHTGTQAHRQAHRQAGGRAGGRAGGPGRSCRRSQPRTIPCTPESPHRCRTAWRPNTLFSVVPAVPAGAFALDQEGHLSRLVVVPRGRVCVGRCGCVVGSGCRPDVDASSPNAGIGRFLYGLLQRVEARVEGHRPGTVDDPTLHLPGHNQQVIASGRASSSTESTCKEQRSEKVHSGTAGLAVGRATCVPKSIFMTSPYSSTVLSPLFGV